jgi:hypothetical protein
MGIETTGKLHTIFETKQVSERFTKREFVVEIADNPKYPQTVLFQLTGDRCSQLDGMTVGDQVTIEFSLRGREWKSPSGDIKYFNSLDVWKLEPARANQGRGRRGSYNGDQRDGAPPPPREYEPRPSDDLSRDADDIPF